MLVKPVYDARVRSLRFLEQNRESLQGQFSERVKVTQDRVEAENKSNTGAGISQLKTLILHEKQLSEHSIHSVGRKSSELAKIASQEFKLEVADLSNRIEREVEGIKI